MRNECCCSPSHWPGTLCKSRSLPSSRPQSATTLLCTPRETAGIASKLFEDLRDGAEDFDDKDEGTEDKPALQPAPERWLTLLQLADSRWDGIRSAARFALASGPREWQTIRLPDSLFAFYGLLRLASVLRNAPTFSPAAAPPKTQDKLGRHGFSRAAQRANDAGFGRWGFPYNNHFASPCPREQKKSRK